MPRILIADDQADVVAALSLLLKGERFQIESASSPAGVLRALDGQEFDVVLIDLNYARDTTSGREGMELVTHVHELDADLPVVVMTAWSTVSLAVDLMRGRGVVVLVSDLYDDEVVAELTRSFPWYENATGRLEIFNRIKLWQALTGDDTYDPDYWVTRVTNRPGRVAAQRSIQPFGRKESA